MITTQHSQEGLSRSYVQAVAAMAGTNITMGSVFDYGFDGSFRPVVKRGNRRVESGYPIDFQLKCTTRWTNESENISYNVETKTYNDLVQRDEGSTGAILILLCLPLEQEKWADFSEDCLTLRKCCYFTILKGSPVANENSTKKILIPRANILTAHSLTSLLAEERERKSGGRSNGSK